MKTAVIAACVFLAPVAALAQIPGFDATMSKTQEVATDHIRWTGDVVLSQPGLKFYADEVDYYPKTNRLVANGNVQAGNWTIRLPPTAPTSTR